MATVAGKKKTVMSNKGPDFEDALAAMDNEEDKPAFKAIKGISSSLVPFNYAAARNESLLGLGLELFVYGRSTTGGGRHGNRAEKSSKEQEADTDGDGITKPADTSNLQKMSQEAIDKLQQQQNEDKRNKYKKRKKSWVTVPTEIVADSDIKPGKRSQVFVNSGNRTGVFS